MTEIGFLGLGTMGSAMATNLVEAGRDVVVWNRRPGPADPLRDAGATVAAAAAEACAARVVMSMLANDEVFASVVLSDEALAAVAPGSIHVNHATVSLELADRAAAAFAERGATYVAAPVFGRPPAAAQGALQIVAAGPPGAVAAIAPLLDVIGERTWVVGEAPRQANLVKILGNFMIATTIETFGEALGLGERLGVDAEQLVDILTGTLFGGVVHTDYGGRIARREYEPAGFAMTLGFKDVNLALDAAAIAGIEMPVGEVVRATFTQAIAAGGGHRDWAAAAEVPRAR